MELNSAASGAAVEMAATTRFNMSVMLPLDEGKFDMGVSTEWMRVNWTRSFVYAAFYALFIFFGTHYMRYRPKVGVVEFELRVPLVVWNLLLAVFSLMGCVRTYPEFWDSLVGKDRGFAYSVCNSSYTLIPETSYWVWLFALSKVLELGDTVFIVLRKQQLIFLHWYHHITVLIYTWYSFPEHTAPGRWFVVMNYSVHAFMYTYYALRALKIRMPRSVPMTITFLQLAQMIVGTLIGVYTYGVKLSGTECQQSYENIRYQLLMYASYFILFAHFFYKVYFRDGKFSVSAAHSRVGSSVSLAGGGDGLDSTTLSVESLSRSLKKAQ